MSSSENLNSLGPACHADGSLKDASEIEWSYDKDKTLPFPAPDAMVNEQDTAPTIHPFFARAAPPVQIVGGAHVTCRSACTHHPSHCVLEAMSDSENQAGPSLENSHGKHKTNVVPSSHQVVCKIVNTSTEDEAESDGDAASIVTDDITVDKAISDTYQQLQEMADANHKVRLLTIELWF